MLFHLFLKELQYQLYGVEHSLYFRTPKKTVLMLLISLPQNYDLQKHFFIYAISKCFESYLPKYLCLVWSPGRQDNPINKSTQKGNKERVSVIKTLTPQASLKQKNGRVDKQQPHHIENKFVLVGIRLSNCVKLPVDHATGDGGVVFPVLCLCNGSEHIGSRSF